MSFLLITAIGLGVGLLLGLTGVGSGSVLTPLLILACGVVPAKAVGTSLAFAFVTKIVASVSFFRRGLVGFSILKKLSPGALAGLLLGFFLLEGLRVKSPQLQSVFLRRAIGIAVLGVFALMVARLFRSPAGHAAAGRVMALAQKHEHTLTFAVGFAVSLTVTLTSIGAGAVLIPSLYLLYRPDSGRLVGTSLFFGTILSAAAGLPYASHGYVDLRALAALLLGSSPAIWLASHLHGRLPRLVSEGIITAAMLVLGLRLAFL